MIRRKWLSASVLALLFFPVLSACGGAADTPTTLTSATATSPATSAAATDTVGATAPATSPTDTTAPSASSTSTSASPVTSATTGAGAGAGADNLSGTVTFWTAYNTVSPEMDTLNNQIIPAFQKLHPNVTVKAQALPYDNLRQKLLTSVAGGETPDLVRADLIWVPEFAELGALAQLDTAMPDFNTIKDQVYPGPLSTNFYKGKYYGLPLDTNTKVSIYNPAVLKAAGVSDTPKTFADFKTACDKIKALGKADTFCYAEGGTGPWSILPWIWSNGGDITNADYTKATGYLNGKATVDAITMLRDMLKNKTLSPSILGNGLATSDAIGKGQAAMIIDGPWMPPIFQKQFPDLKYTLAPLPSGAGGSVSVVGGEDIVLFDKSQNKEAAIAFMRYMLSPEAQTAMGKIGQMPVLKSLGGSKDFPDYYAVFQTQLETAKARTPSPAWPKIDETISNAVLSVMRGEKEPQAALDEAATAVDGLLAGKK